MNDTTPVHSTDLKCNYLVVGAGTAGLSFIDTLISESSTATVIMVDRNSNAGGHWTKAYPFVQLHQTSCNYGINSLRLGKTLDSKGCEAFDINDRASGIEIVEYYDKAVEKFKETGRFRYFFDVEFKEKNGLYSVINKSGDIIHVKCDKVVTVATNVVVPSMRGPLFPIDDRINVVSVNGLQDSVTSCNYKKYVIMGAGKTGVDAVIELLRNGISQSEITWIISRDVWYVLRDGIFNVDNYWKGAEKLFKPILKENSIVDVFLSLEKAGSIGRLTDKIFPNIFKGPTINTDELDLLRSIKDIVRLGRIVSISLNEIFFEKGTMEFDMNGTLFVDCMVDKLYGYEDFPDNFKFFEPGRINLGPALALFNISFTSAIVAYLEATFNNDEIKNKFCFPLLGKYGKAIPATLIGGIYSQSKQLLALASYPPAMKFALNSRTNLDAPMHHGGMIKFIWALYGPLQMRKYSNKLITRVDNFSYDVEHTFGNGRSHKIDPEEIKASLTHKKTQNNSRSKKSKRFACCKSNEAVIST